VGWVEYGFNIFLEWVWVRFGWDIRVWVGCGLSSCRLGRVWGADQSVQSSNTHTNRNENTDNVLSQYMYFIYTINQDTHKWTHRNVAKGLLYMICRNDMLYCNLLLCLLSVLPFNITITIKFKFTDVYYWFIKYKTNSKKFIIKQVCFGGGINQDTHKWTHINLASPFLLL